jgi:aminopeptidase N
VQYEQQFSQWQSKAQPSITHIDAQVDFYPTAQRANFVVTYTLLNHHDTAIEQVLLGRAGRYAWADVQLDGAKQIAFDDGLKQAVYAFDKPLQPGERRTLRSEFTYKQPKLWPIRGHQFVTPELSYIRAVPLLPTVGYQTNYEIHDPQLRADYQLPEKKHVLPSILFAEQATRLGRYDWLTLTSTITTDAGHHGLSQGELLSQSQSEGRNVFVYRTNTPMSAIPAWLSMPFDSISQQQGGVTLQVFSPRKGQGEDINLKAMADTLAWFANNVAPYRAKQLSLVSVPEIGVRGYALPQIMLINDRIGFRAHPADDAGFDQRYRIAVHETAHQWFGHDIGHGVAQDHAFLIESMAKYIELVLLETHYGKPAMDALLQHEKIRYQQGVLADVNSKVALVNTTQNHDQYSRATVVFAQLRKRLGDEVITQALRQLWQIHRYPNVPANAMDFVRSLKKATGKENHALIETLLIKP